MYFDAGSNVTLVASNPLLHNVMQTNNEVGNIGRGTAKTTHIGGLHMLLETIYKQLLLIVKQACVMPSNNHNTFGLSTFLIHVCNRVSHEMPDRVNIDIDDNN